MTMRESVTGVPEYALDPVRKAATLATNSRDRKPTVEIICGVSSKGRWCSNLLGGVWTNEYGTVVIVNRLERGDRRDYYRTVAYDREERLRIWNEEGFVVEEPVLLRRDGRWRTVPGEERLATVRCLRHGSWLLDLNAVVKRFGEARTVGKALKYGSAPPS
jgi:hypothetical protein